MTTYKINDFYDQVSMKLTVNWQHPDAEAGIREMSMFWSGHPAENAHIEKHFDFFVRVMADRAYALSREDNWDFSPKKIHQLVFDSEGFCGNDKPWIRLSSFVDESADVDWEVKKIEGEKP